MNTNNATPPPTTVHPEEDSTDVNYVTSEDVSGWRGEAQTPVPWPYLLLAGVEDTLGMNTPTTEASFAATENSSSNNNIYDEYIIIVRFASAAHLQVWMQSADRQLMVDRVTEFSLDGTLPSYTSFHSLEHWFVTLEDAQMSNTNKSAGAGGALTRPPAKWKMVLVTVVIIYSQSLWIAKVIQKLAPNMNPYAIQLINVALLVLVATYVLFPIVTRPFSFWLTPGVDYADKLRELIPSGVLQTKEKKQNEETTLNTQHDQPNQF